MSDYSVILADSQNSGANSVQGVVVPAAASASPLSEKHEHFCRELMEHGNVGDAYRAVYPRAGSRNAAWANGCRLRARQDVQERLREMRAAAAARALIKPAALLWELYELATADPAEVSRVVVEPCRDCWPTDALAAALDRAGAGDGEPPDTSVPDPTCKRCRGHGITQVIHTPTDQLRGAARRLYAGAKTKSDGSVEVAIVDQLAARREIHDLLGMRVNRSESKNLNVNVNTAAPDVSVDAVLAAFHRGRERRDG